MEGLAGTLGGVDHQAKAKLGAAPFKLLCTRSAKPAGTADTPGVFFAGLRVVTVDGFTLDAPDTGENAAFFDRGSYGSASKNPYPQMFVINARWWASPLTLPVMLVTLLA